MTSSISSNARLAKSDVKLEPFPFVDESKRASDPVGYRNSFEQRTREAIIAQERVKIVREQLAECYNREGVNHYQNCKEIAQKYYKLITTPGYGLFAKPQE